MFNQYQPNLDNMQQYLNQENEKSNRGDGPNWWSIPSGMSSVRILPPWDPTGRVALTVFNHPIEFQGKDMSYTKYNWTCVNKTFNKPCPICEGLASMQAAGVDTSKWEAYKKLYYFNAIIMHDPNYNQATNSGTAPGTHVLMRAPKTFNDWIISQITNPMIGDITNTQNGIDVYITKEGQGLGTTYTMTLSPNGRTPIPQEYLDKITDLYNLDDIFSTGFDQEQIDELVNHLKNSAGVLSNNVGQVVNQMAGYTQAPQIPVPQQLPPTYPQGGLNYNQYPPQQAPVAPQAVPPQQMSTPAPMVPPAPSAPSAPVAPTSAPVAPSPQTKPENLPNCYGQYDAGSVNCVVCPHEVSCMQSKQ